MTWQYLRCLLFGHDDDLMLNRRRLFLKCQSCGHESPGWALDGPAPRIYGRRILRFEQRLKRSLA